MRRSHSCLAGLAAVCIAMAALPAQADPSAADSIEAIWNPQSIVFNFRSEGRLYPCAILEYKIRLILRRLGASDRLQIRSDHCRDLGGQARFEALLESPVEATTENIRAVTSYGSREQLVARVRGEQLPSPAEVQTFVAAWESISFRSEGKLDIDGGDCALVQQLRRQVMTKMSVRVTRDIARVDCSQELTSIAVPHLTVVALVPMNPR